MLTVNPRVPTVQGEVVDPSDAPQGPKMSRSMACHGYPSYEGKAGDSMISMEKIAEDPRSQNGTKMQQDTKDTKVYKSKLQMLVPQAAGA